MPNVIFIDAAGKSKTIDCAVGTSLMKSAQLNGISGIYAECGGQQMCATCHIYVAEEFRNTMPEVSVDEDEMLEATASDRLPNSRLSCAIIVTPEHENLVVHLPKYQR
ncbi:MULTISPECIES: 2Fe-2S iron-sulfur cluster-binding protein [unclassified Beijerinckia]|uniref:2Fe-2S iron-sulfur cluster-binding protein n=1 Tax=unclassified Beijerinckia TaxID=2638183 RepID=UPI00089D6624|nr:MULTISPECIES: 2Fe-2S iron-sulfur cluster-binding protein [unclassified Beijerinckia]MDH7797058.1 2Fe-2S ferredoxin [Beijerinckia sp. GAS462]SEC70559.1 ferredoxin, 2Fe-2S [Beijerinckia sp. 28-YEA-48]